MKLLSAYRFSAFLMLALLASSFAMAQETIGVVAALSGTASIVRNSVEIPAKSGTPIFENDIINSDVNSRVQILLKDQTAINL
ncbi:MAG: hypothetical protein QNK99_04805, partial [Burkholderiales bacterium]